MAKLGGISSHLKQTSHNPTVPLDTILKDNENYWKQSLPSLHTSNGQILEYIHVNRSGFKKLTVPINHCTAVLPRANIPQHSNHFCLNNRPPETSTTVNQLWLPKCPIQLRFVLQNTSASVTTNVSQQSIQQMIVLNTNNLNESNLYSLQEPVKINNLPKDSISQGLLTDVRHFGILAQAQPSKLCPQNACVSKDNHQQKSVSQKAIAVVTPLTQKVAAGVSFSKNLPKVIGHLETGSVSNKYDHHPCIPHTLQPTTNATSEETLYDNTLLTKDVSSKSVLPSGISHVHHDGPTENESSVPNESLSSVPLNITSIETKEAMQLCTTNENLNAKLLSENHSMRMDQNSEGIETTMELSPLAVNEWSLQRLRTLVTDLEQLQKSQQKAMPCNDLPNEIVSLYWDKDYKTMFNAAKTDVYTNIMKEVRLHCETENSVILQEVSRERLDASSFYILEHGVQPPKMVYTSSWLNLNDKLDIDKPNIAEKEMTVKKKWMENMQDPTSEKINASSKALNKRNIRFEALSLEHQKHSGVKMDRMEGKERVVMDVENTYSTKKTEEQDNRTVNNAMTKIAESEKINTENEAPLLVSLNTQSSDVCDGCIKPVELHNLPTTDTTPVLDRNGSADCIADEVDILPPVKARRWFDGDTEVDSTQKDDAKILTISTGHLELFDQDKKQMDTEIKSDENNNQFKIRWQLESYCCLAKWFQVLGYRNGGHCMCEKKTELINLASTSGKVAKEVSADKHRLTFSKFCKLNDAKRNKRLGSQSMPRKKSVSATVDDDTSIDEIKILEVITNYDYVLKIANAMSGELVATRPIAHTSHESTTDRKQCRDHHKKFTDTHSKTEEALINLTLFGTSHQRQKKNTSGFKSLFKDYLPPEKINVRIGSGWNEYPNSAKIQTPKQKVWNSWNKTHVPSKKSTNRRSKLKKRTKSTNYASGNPVIKTTESELNTTLLSHHEDAQTHQVQVQYENTFSMASADRQRSTGLPKKNSKKNISSTTEDKLRKLIVKKSLATFTLKKRRNCAKNGSKQRNYFDPVQTINSSKKELNTNFALHFGVLPESFNISDGTSSMEANRSASADSGSKVKTLMQTKRTWSKSGVWCDSPRKKQCLKSSINLPNSSGLSTFQEFKKKYEEKKQGIPT